MRNATYETSVSNAANDISAYTSINLGTTITPVKNWETKIDYTYANNETSSLSPGTSFYAGDTWESALDVKDGSGNVLKTNNIWNKYNGLGETINAKVLNLHRYTASGSNPDHIYRDAYVSRRQTLNITSSYDLSFGQHKIKPMIGMNGVDYEREGNWSRIAELMDYGNPQFDLSKGTQTCGGGHSWSSTLGFFGRLNYYYKDKYLLEGNVRYDGTSKFPKDLKWRWFYSFSGGWRVTEEPWMDNIKDVLSSLKLRASWGKIGDQTVSSSLYIPRMSKINSNWIHDASIDVFYSTPDAVVPDITWQDISSLDFGFDAKLFNDFGITFDWYRRDTKNMIVPAEGVGYGFGASAPMGNYGNLRTNGFEVQLDYNHIFDNGLSLAVTATLSDAVTKITKYGTGKIVTSWYNGKTYGEIWGYRVDRLFQNEDFARDEAGNLIKITAKDGYKVYKFTDESMPTQGFLNDGSLIFGPGDVKFKDINGDGVINKGNNSIDDHGDLEVIGNSTPRYEYSFNISLGYKNFDFSMFWQGIGKRNLWGTSAITIAGYNAYDGAIAKAFAKDFWYETIEDSKVIASNYNAFYPRAASLGNRSVFNMTPNDRYLLNMAYLRLKNVTLGYTLPEKLTRRAFINKLRVYVSLENFLTFDHLRGLPVDPEVISGYSVFNTTNYNSSRTGVGVPAFKSASFGVQLTF